MVSMTAFDVCTTIRDDDKDPLERLNIGFKADSGDWIERHACRLGRRIDG